MFDSAAVNGLSFIFCYSFQNSQTLFPAFEMHRSKIPKSANELALLFIHDHKCHGTSCTYALTCSLARTVQHESHATVFFSAFQLFALLIQIEMEREREKERECVHCKNRKNAQANSFYSQARTFHMPNAVKRVMKVNRKKSSRGMGKNSNQKCHQLMLKYEK